MPMKDGAAVLAALRNNPAIAIAAWGFTLRGAPLTNAVGGGCTLACAPRPNTTIYQITVTAGGTDWYIPYANNAARYCDVPRGQPNGTLVVTFPMNGCALEVRLVNGNNRFYHDADANSMPGDPPGERKIRVEPADYQGPGRPLHERAQARYFGQEVQQGRLQRGLNPNVGGYQHNIICVMRDSTWSVYGSAVIFLNGDAWQIKDRVPYHLGDFED